MRNISSEKIRETVSVLCIEANVSLRRDILDAIKKAFVREKKRAAKEILRELIDNAAIAKREKLPICQDTGAVVVYCEIGQSVSILGDDLTNAINRGVGEGYRKGYLRKSIVGSPLDRKNTDTNTPAIIHTVIVPGDKIKISVCPKGFGSENKSKIKMLNPTASIKEIKGFILDVVKECGPEACPPLVLGIGLGGTFEKAAELAKKALLRPINKKNPNKDLDRLEKELLGEINALNIGPMGMGGKTTALGVNILDFPTHIAGLPVAVCVSCHATRGSEKVI